MERTDGTTTVFISFRNGDDPFAAALLTRALGRRFGPACVFRSSESIALGDRWEQTIWANHRASDAVVVVIGPRWLTIAGETGRPRLREDKDWVRAEIAVALADRKLVIPVLVEGTRRFVRADLPDDIADLADLQSIWLSHRSIEMAVERLGARIAGEAGGTGPAPANDHGSSTWLNVWNVPSQPTLAMSRDAAIDAVHAAVAGGRPVVLHGPIGTGKSQLAAEYVRRYAGDFESVWWLRPDGVALQFTTLAAAAGFHPGDDIMADLPALVSALRRRGRLLVVLDGFDDRQDAVPVVTALAAADILITSRERDWGMLADRVRVDAFTRAESVALLAAVLPDAAADSLDRVAAAVQDLPAAVAQAAVFVRETAIDPDEYIALLATRTPDILDRGDPLLGAPTLAAAWSLARQRVVPALADLLDLVSVLAPAPVPMSLVAASVDPIERIDLARACASAGLIEMDGSTLLPGALFQAFVRHGLSEPRRDDLRAEARSLLARAPRGEPDDPGAWAGYDVLVPHALAVDLAASGDPRARRAVIDIARHLVVRADAGTARGVIAPALAAWSRDLGPGHDDVLDAAACLARVLYRLDRPVEAVALDRDVWERRTARLGADHPTTLDAAHNLAIDQWAEGIDRPAARALLDRVIEGRTRVLGADDPDTLRSAHNLGLMLRAAGDIVEALATDERTYRSFVAVLGPDHPDTLRSGYALAFDLRSVGDPGARDLGRETYDRALATLGADHPETLRAAYGCAVDLRAAGDIVEAYEMADGSRQRRERALGDEHPDTLRSTYLAAVLARDLGHADGPDRVERASAALVALRDRRRRIGE